MLKSSFKKVIGSALAAGLLLGTASFAHASVLQGGVVTPQITAGTLPDHPLARVDPNVPSSPFSGVVSINIRHGGQGFICSGALVGKRQVVSAGHCVDSSGNGTVVDINKPGSDVAVVFNNNGNFNALVAATKVSIEPNYQGFGHCPPGIDSFCANDDLAVITLGQDAPADAKIYKVAVNPVTAGTHIMMAGYGTSGDGVNGYTILPSFTVKRTGENYMDLFDGDDEQGGAGGPEVWYADFDGGGKDTFCDGYGVCTPKLANGREAGIGGGDSGGPSFVDMYGELMLVANNTFTGTLAGQKEGTFGNYFGGIVLGSYTDYLVSATGGEITLVPEPGGAALLGIGVLMLWGATCRRSLVRGRQQAGLTGL